MVWVIIIIIISIIKISIYLLFECSQISAAGKYSESIYESWIIFFYLAFKYYHSFKVYTCRHTPQISYLVGKSWSNVDGCFYGGTLRAGYSSTEDY